MNRLIVDWLSPMTDHHCAYCDGFPLEVLSLKSLDHFRPKHPLGWPQLAFDWNNLYLACEVCQGRKAALFDEILLRPDDATFEFDRCFIFNEKSGDLEPNPGASDLDQKSAQVTIEILGLNWKGRPVARRRESDRFRELQAIGKSGLLEDWPYRFLLSAEAPA